MGPRIPPGTRFWLGGLAAGGVAAAHLLAFLVVAPDPLRREQLLEATGHGIWPLVVSLAMGAMVVGLAGFVASSRPRQGQLRAFPVRTAGRLILLQTFGFLALESLERLAMGKGPGALTELPFEPVVVIGLAAQVIVALAGAMLLAFLDRLFVKLAEVRSMPRPTRALVSSRFAELFIAQPQVAAGPVKPRGPPDRI
jgi:hypothetical protein